MNHLSPFTIQNFNQSRPNRQSSNDFTNQLLVPGAAPLPARSARENSVKSTSAAGDVSHGEEVTDTAVRFLFHNSSTKGATSNSRTGFTTRNSNLGGAFWTEERCPSNSVAQGHPGKSMRKRHYMTPTVSSSALRQEYVHLKSQRGPSGDTKTLIDQ